jgi:hypothetical protein
MKVLGHDHISQNGEAVAAAHLFQHIKEEVAAGRHAEKGAAAIAASSDKVQIAAAIVVRWVSGHRRRIGLPRQPSL